VSDTADPLHSLNFVGIGAPVKAIMDRIFKAITERVKEKSAIEREFFRIAYERKRARHEMGYTSKVLNK
jgi:hypothetical protein